MDAAARWHSGSYAATRAALLSSLLLAFLGTAAVGGCGQSISTPLPEISSRNDTAAKGQQTLSNAEQKKAIDALVAKRDAAGGGQTQTQPASQAQSK